MPNLTFSVSAGWEVGVEDHFHCLRMKSKEAKCHLMFVLPS